MNSTTLKGNWNILKGKVRERWGKITDNDLEQIQGRSDQLLGTVQRAYGLSKDEAQRQIDAFEEECECNRDEQRMEEASLTADEQEDDPTLEQPRTGRQRDDDEN